MNRQTYNSKRRAMREKSIIELLELLKSEDLPTRFLAEMSLRDQTGV